MRSTFRYRKNLSYLFFFVNLCCPSWLLPFHLNISFSHCDYSFLLSDSQLFYPIYKQFFRPLQLCQTPLLDDLQILFSYTAVSVRVYSCHTYILLTHLSLCSLLHIPLPLPSEGVTTCPRDSER